MNGRKRSGQDSQGGTLRNGNAGVFKVPPREQEAMRMKEEKERLCGARLVVLILENDRIVSDS